MGNFNENYGSNAFTDAVMKERLPKATYKALKKTIEKGAVLDLEVANVIASTLRDWAVEKGATHFTHWFQPLTDTTAEKHDAFVSPTSDGKALLLLNFDCKEDHNYCSECFYNTYKNKQLACIYCFKQNTEFVCLMKKN